MLYSGKLGIAVQTEVRPGVWEETITEHPVVGKVITRTETLDQGDEILPRYRTTTNVSVFGRGVGAQDNSMIRYVTHAGKRWTIGSVADIPPRLSIYIGEEYHGPLPEPTD